MAKYKQTIKEMLESHPELFKNFKEVHDNYISDPDKWQEKFNTVGQEVLHVIQKWEGDLCSKSNQTQYSKFAVNLSDKFRGEIKTFFPKLDYIGLQ